MPINKKILTLGKTIILAMSLGFWCHPLAASIIEISDQTAGFYLENGVTYLNDDAGEHHPSDLLHSNEFTEILTKVHQPSLYITSTAVTWIRFQLKNIGPKSSLFYLTYSDKLASVIEVYNLNDNDKVTQPMLGGRSNLGKSESATYLSTFPLNIPAGETRTILTKVLSNQSSQLIPKISNPREFLFDNNRFFILFGMRLGTAVTALFGILLFVGQNNRSTFFSCLIYIISVVMVSLTKETYCQKYFGSHLATWMANNAVAILLFAVAARAYFCTNQLQTKLHHPKGHKILSAIMVLAAGMILFVTVTPNVNIWMWAARLTALSLLASIAIAFQSVRREVAESRSYLVGSIIFVFFAGISGAAEFGFLPSSHLVHASLFIGTSLEMISLGIGHASRKRAREKASSEEKALANYEAVKLAVHNAHDLEREILAAESAKKHSASKSDFLAKMSHELRTPLTVIVGYSQLLNAEYISPTESKSYVSNIVKSSQHLLALVDEVLDLSKIEAGKIEINPVPVNFLAEFSDIITMLSDRAKSGSLALKVEFAGEIPRKITTSPLRLRQILINVIGNAAKFTDHGEVQVKVCLASDRRLTFEVTDTGCGMTELQQQRLFQPFTQADSSITRRYGGTGLGLALSRQLAQAMGGNIELAWSKINEGSCFIVEIDPGEISDLREVNHASWQSGHDYITFSDSKVPQMTKLRLLLVEDSLELRDLLKIYIEATGAQIDVAANGAEAVSLCMSHRYDAILMDIQMPILDGYQATEQLLSLGYKAPIIALTAHAMTTERDLCLARGFTDYLSKPVTPHDLFAMLGKHTSIDGNPRN